jgi:hypothetical protein
MAEGKRKYLLAKKVRFKGQEMTKEQIMLIRFTHTTKTTGEDDVDI